MNLEDVDERFNKGLNKPTSKKVLMEITESL